MTYTKQPRCEYTKTNHVLIHCPKAAMIWHLIFALFGVHWVLPNSIKETILGWNDTFVGKKRKDAWNAAPLCLFWTLWKERNRRIFEDIELADQAILRSFLYMFSDWVRVHVDCTSWGESLFLGRYKRRCL